MCGTSSLVPYSANPSSWPIVDLIQFPTGKNPPQFCSVVRELLLETPFAH